MHCVCVQLLTQVQGVEGCALSVSKPRGAALRGVLTTSHLYREERASHMGGSLGGLYPLPVQDTVSSLSPFPYRIPIPLP